MRLVLDQGLPRSAVDELRADGTDTVHVSDEGLAAAEDEAILAWALAQNRVVVTLDADFHALLAVGGRAGPSVVRLRVEGLRGPAAARLIATVVRLCADDLACGAVVTVTERRVRVRRLPLGRRPSDDDARE